MRRETLYNGLPVFTTRFAVLAKQRLWSPVTEEAADIWIQG